MQYNTLGSTGLVVSRMALGAMTFGSGEGALGSIYKVDQKLADELAGAAMDAGINFFNTADAYAGGASERMLGKALGARRKDVVITTKVGFRTGDAVVQQGLSRHHILNGVEASLARLGTDYIDVYIAHRLDPLTPLEETLAAFDSAVRAGKVRYIGFSNWPAWAAAKAVGLQIGRGWTQFRAAELYYSLVGRDVEHELLPLLGDTGIGALAWSPLAGGFLTGRYTREKPQGDGGRLSAFDIIPFDRDRGYEVVDALGGIAGAQNVSIAAVALAWLLTRAAVASVLIGASKMSQLQDNLRAVDVKLTEQDLKKLDSLTEPPAIYPNWFNRKIRDEITDRALGGGEKGGGSGGR
jgi:aryl-alcohol dehydrogenase-like predicted oxidoreductase